jgi:hypothetical protein
MKPHQRKISFLGTLTMTPTNDAKASSLLQKKKKNFSPFLVTSIAIKIHASRAASRPPNGPTNASGEQGISVTVEAEKKRKTEESVQFFPMFNEFTSAGNHERRSNAIVFFLIPFVFSLGLEIPHLSLPRRLERQA